MSDDTTTTTTTTTAQITLAALEHRDESRKACISRIEALMIPGARALAGTRDGSSGYWLEREHNLTDRAPFTGRTMLIWRDAGLSQSQPRRPFDLDRPSYSTQVIIPSAATPAQLTELARIAELLTADIVRECEAETAGKVAALEAERAALEQIAR